MSYYLDPKKPRHLGARGRKAKLEAMARQRAAEAKRQKWRMIVHGSLMATAVWCFKHTDIHSADPFESVTLVLLDIMFAMYLMGLLFIEIWRR